MVGCCWDNGGAGDDDDDDFNWNDDNLIIRDPAVFCLVLDFYRTGRLHGRKEVRWF